MFDSETGIFTVNEDLCPNYPARGVKDLPPFPPISTSYHLDLLTLLRIVEIAFLPAELKNGVTREIVPVCVI